MTNNIANDIFPAFSNWEAYQELKKHENDIIVYLRECFNNKLLELFRNEFKNWNCTISNDGICISLINIETIRGMEL